MRKAAMRERFIRGTARFVVRFYVPIVILAAALAIVSFPRAKHLFTNIDTDLTKLLPEHYKSVEQIERIRKLFKTTKALSVIVEGDDSEKARKFAVDLSEHLKSDPAVSEADIKKRGYEFFDKHKLMYIELDDLHTIRDRIDRRIQREKLGSLYIDFEEQGAGPDEEFKFGDLDDKYKNKYSSGVRSEYNTNDAGTIYVMYVRPTEWDGGIPASREFYAHIRDGVERFAASRSEPSVKIHFSDSIRTHVEEYDTLIRDLSRAGIISGLGIFLVLLLYFRRVFAAALVFAPLTMGILMTFAFSSLHIKNLNLVTSFLFAILGGLGVEIGIHLLARYIEERRAGTAAGEAIFRMLYHTGGSALTSAATVAATFWVLVINDFKGFSEFGYIAGTGLIINYAVYVLVFPSLLILAEKLRILSFRRGIGFDRVGRGAAGQARTTSPSPAPRFPLPRFTLLGFAVLLAITLIDLPRVNFEWRFSMIKANVPAAKEAREKQRETSSSVNSPAAVVIRTRDEADAIKAAIEASQAAAGSANVIDAFKSSHDLIPPNQPEKLTVIGEMQDLLADKTLKLVKGEHKKDIDRFREALAEADPVEEHEVPESVREIFKGNTGETDYELAYINPLPRMELDDGRNAMRFAEQIGRIDTPIGTFYPSSDAIVFADVLRTMISDGKRVVALAFILVCAIVWIDFRSWKAAAMVVSPIVLGVLYTFLIMYVLDIRLNFYNIVVIPTSVGTSIDNAIHLYHRYKEMGRGSVVAAWRSSGSAALTSSLTNIFGFMGLCFTSHSGLKSIGSLAVAGLVACLLTTLLFFPALLQFLEDRGYGPKEKGGPLAEGRPS